MNKKDFTRDRKLPFSKVLLTIVRKSVKSIQNVLNETQKHLSVLLDEDLDTVSKSAYSQARDKLNYTAFKELANDTRDMLYRDYDYKTYKGFRLLAIDGSMVTLPFNDDIKKEFCTTNVINQSNLTLQDIARLYNPVLRGWLQYYGKFYPSALYPMLRHFNQTLVAWARRKYKKLDRHKTRAGMFIEEISKTQPNLFPHWKRGMIGGFA